MNRLARGFFLLIVPGVPACAGGTSSPAQDPAALGIASAGDRLRGRWVLVDYQAATPLEPNLQQFLQLEFGRLSVVFNGSRMIADGPGVHLDRAYRILEGYADHFRAAVYDEAGVATESGNDFLGDRLIIDPGAMPWRGRATLRRLGP